MIVTGPGGKGQRAAQKSDQVARRLDQFHPGRLVGGDLEIIARTYESKAVFRLNP